MMYWSFICLLAAIAIGVLTVIGVLGISWSVAELTIGILLILCVVFVLIGAAANERPRPKTR